jgi:hypothetical protein
MREMDLIDTKELKEKLDRGDGFTIVMTLSEWEYRTTHPRLDAHQHSRGSAKGA